MNDLTLQERLQPAEAPFQTPAPDDGIDIIEYWHAIEKRRWSILGLAALSYAKRALALKELKPDKTIGVLKNDGVWIESEVKHQI